MTGAPKVSIGLPVYNGENYLEQSVQSILDQTFGDFELIISDNASTDATGEICRGFAAEDARVRYFRQERNLGLALNSNFTFQVARGSYFKWVSHDDLHSPRFLETCLDALERERDAVLACPRYRLIDEAGNEIAIRREKSGHFWVNREGKKSPIRPYDPPRRLHSSRASERFRDLLLKTNWDIEIYGVVRADALRRTGLHGTYHGTDKRILAELTLMGRFVEIPEVMFLYRQHPVQALLYKASTAVRDRYLGGGGLPSLVPRFQNLLGYARAVKQSALPALEKARCYAAIAEWVVRPGRWPALTLETWRNLRDIVAGHGRRAPARVS